MICNAAHRVLRELHKLEGFIISKAPVSWYENIYFEIILDIYAQYVEKILNEIPNTLNKD